MPAVEADRSRRRFLGRMLALTGCGLMGSFPHPSRATPTGVERPAAPRKMGQERALDLLDRHRAFDLHTHPGLFPMKGLSPDYAGDDAVAETVSDMLAGHLHGAFFSLIADRRILEIGSDGIRQTRAFEEGEAWADYERQASTLRDLLAVLPAEWATGAGDLEALQERGHVAAFVACEGGDCLEGRPERLERMYADGVRSLQLVHYARNELGDLQTAEPQHDGLSAVGREVVREMNRLGMLIDVAHASFATVEDVADASDAPFVLSHSQLAWGDRRHARFLDPAHARLVADAGGVIGMWPSGFGNDTFADFVDNTLRLVELVSVDHVGLGTDMDGNYRPVFDNYRQLPDWAEALLAKGLSAREVGKLVGENALGVLRRVVG